MKKLLFISTIFLSSLVYGQDTTKLSVRTVYEDAKSGITKVVAQLGGPAKHVYGVYTRQHFAEGIADLLTYLVVVFPSLLLFMNLMFSCKKVGKELVDNNDWPTSRGLIAIMTGIVGVIGTIIFLFSSNYIYTHIFNPEYYAIQDIIKAFK